ncbi:unnamed protein product [Prunus armeniaca]|uniref:Uncharacterized protein n=1 Tax=Prunus armeniaca TaxID=36596 RepID=A0A6J5VNF7_PRUAR|nr:unnamed protein product [Prunus armeniaca]
MERTELAGENNDLPRPPPDLAVEENIDLGFSEVAFDINKLEFAFPSLARATC